MILNFSLGNKLNYLTDVFCLLTYMMKLPVSIWAKYDNSQNLKIQTPKFKEFTQ